MRMVKTDGNGVIRLIEAADPVPGPGEVVVRTAVSAICGSELGAYRGAGVAAGNGGHEGAGTVIAVGPGVEHPRLGDRVGVSSVAGCGHCGYCARGQYTYCHNRRFYGNMHAERFLAAANACHVLPDDVPWQVGVLITGDGLGVAYHAATRIGRPVNTVAVFGLGPTGLGHTLLQSYLGRTVIGVEPTPYRRDLAGKLGAVTALDPHEPGSDVVERVRALTGGEGPDLCIEAAGKPETLHQCFAAVRTGGMILITGEQSRVDLSPSEDFIRRDITVSGSWFYHFGEFLQMLDLYRRGLRVADLVTHVFPAPDAGTAFREFAAGRTGKALLRWPG